MKREQILNDPSRNFEDWKLKKHISRDYDSQPKYYGEFLDRTGKRHQNTIKRKRLCK